MSKDDHLKKCPACSGLGYSSCDCWPGDCICGYGDMTCEECGGEGVIDTSYEDDPWDGHDPMEEQQSKPSEVGR